MSSLTATLGRPFHDVVSQIQPTQLLLWVATFAAVVFAYLWQHASSKAKARQNNAFPFLELPPEIRETIYGHLVEIDPSYPKLQPEKNLWLSLSGGLTQLYVTGEAQVLRSRSLQRCRRQVFRFLSSRLPTTSTRVKHALKATRRTIWRYIFRSKSPLLFVNRQVHKEYVSVLCRKAQVQLYIQDDNQSDEPLWNISPTMAEQIRRCEVKLIVTPGMTGSFDPRVAPAEWALGDRAVAEMKHFKRLEHMTLQIHACGNQIWNPAWLWHYTSQSFKKSQLKGFKSITFHLKADGWFAGENYLQRNEEGNWDWHCSKGHFVRHDTAGTMSIREFCRVLYDECHECSPWLVDEEDSEDDSEIEW